ncbi:uncharacterized protein BJX67DRAFT_85498 [Aspergillus lucknowensis]|uniref:Uncharacterized protein n=1 Tax=Aspergillus lucknowensis TaxID=176173 RepID=A0ABR4LSA9_9EURO
MDLNEPSDGQPEALPSPMKIDSEAAALDEQEAGRAVRADNPGGGMLGTRISPSSQALRSFSLLRNPWSYPESSLVRDRSNRGTCRSERGSRKLTESTKTLIPKFLTARGLAGIRSLLFHAILAVDDTNTDRVMDAGRQTRSRVRVHPR